MHSRLPLMLFGRTRNNSPESIVINSGAGFEPAAPNTIWCLIMLVRLVSSARYAMTWDDGSGMELLNLHLFTCFVIGWGSWMELIAVMILTSIGEQGLTHEKHFVSGWFSVVVRDFNYSNFWPPASISNYSYRVRVCSVKYSLVGSWVLPDNSINGRFVWFGFQHPNQFNSWQIQFKSSSSISIHQIIKLLFNCNSYHHHRPTT